VSQLKRKLVEEAFGWGKIVASRAGRPSSTQGRNWYRDERRTVIEVMKCGCACRWNKIGSAGV
jgi:hypothetical protein